MERQKTTTQIKHNDDFSKALVEATASYFSGKKIVSEEQIPSLQKKGNEDNFTHKDPKQNASSADPAVDLRTGSGVKQSHGATIKYTNVVAKEEKEGKWEGSEDDKAEDKKLAKKNKMSTKDWEKSDADKKHDMKKEEWEKAKKEEKGEKKHKEGKAEEKKEKMKESFNVMVDGIHYVFEKKNAEGKEQGADGKACWKGYKYAGTKNGKDQCVKAGYEPIGELMLDEKAPPGAKYERMVKHIKKGYSKDGLTDKEKSIAYATAWKEKGKKEDYDVDTANQLWSEVSERLEKLGEMDGAKFKVIGEKMDPVGKEDGDINNDGKKDNQDKYLMARRNKIAKILSKHKKIKEEAEIRLEIEEEKK